MTNRFSCLEFIDDPNIYKIRDNLSQIILNFNRFFVIFIQKNQQNRGLLTNAKIIENTA